MASFSAGSAQFWMLFVSLMLLDRAVDVELGLGCWCFEFWISADVVCVCCVCGSWVRVMDGAESRARGVLGGGVFGVLRDRGLLGSD
ncbi:hypothetical protein KC19_11G065700 [Ceratodon purpureus]|uniref:Secreted protein n=1 Tax=Ceratodon purpureus TaxID=3225 RepID=A0A8T0GHE7_CERPU|nr:hypothetical protein KC19_11G065700 [Ceratodon purpureus]